MFLSLRMTVIIIILLIDQYQIYVPKIIRNPFENVSNFSNVWDQRINKLGPINKFRLAKMKNPGTD